MENPTNQTGFIFRLPVSEVFTPRRTDVNKSIYVERPELQTELRRALQGSMHVVIFGDSGSGKSWLYKKVMEDLGAHICTANCGNAARLNSVTTEIHNAIIPEGTPELTGYDEEKKAALKIPLVEGVVSNTRSLGSGNRIS
jgi:Cdc6-like AAA superfamily ATPase